MTQGAGTDRAVRERSAERPIGAAGPPAWTAVADLLHERSLRWTPQRQRLVDVLVGTNGHVTGSELVERCRDVDPTTTPSTVYRTLAVLEDLGFIRHHHGMDGREEFHVLPDEEHGHLYCRGCGGEWEIAAAEAATIAEAFRRGRAFDVDPSHVTIVGTCAGCREGLAAEPRATPESRGSVPRPRARTG